MSQILDNQSQAFHNVYVDGVMFFNFYCVYIYNS